MIIVLLVRLVNRMREMIKNHMTVGVARLGLGSLITLAITFGLFAAMSLTGPKIPVEAPLRLLPIPEDAFFSALAALGHLFLFTLPSPITCAYSLFGVATNTPIHLHFHLVI